MKMRITRRVEWELAWVIEIIARNVNYQMVVYSYKLNIGRSRE